MKLMMEASASLLLYRRWVSEVFALLPDNCFTQDVIDPLSNKYFSSAADRKVNLMHVETEASYSLLL